MGDITIYVTTIDPGDDHNIVASATGIIDIGATGEPIFFQASWAHSALAATVNSTIKDAAIAAALAQKDYVVGALDKKTLLGGAVGL